jgi:hypothetical protein
MSISWGVVPSQPVSGFCDWLTKAGLEVPQLAGRYPSLEELQVVKSPNVIPIREEKYAKSAGRIAAF